MTRCRVTAAAPRRERLLGERAGRASQRRFHTCPVLKDENTSGAEVGEKSSPGKTSRGWRAQCLGRLSRTLSPGSGEHSLLAGALDSISERGAGPPGKTRCFSKENIHSSPESKTNTLTMTAWPRWPRPKGKEVPQNRKRHIAKSGWDARTLVGPAENKHICTTRRDCLSCSLTSTKRWMWRSPLLHAGNGRLPPRCEPSLQRHRAGVAWPALGGSRASQGRVTVGRPGSDDGGLHQLSKVRWGKADLLCGEEDGV